MAKQPKKRLSWLGVLILVAALCAAAFLLARFIVLRRTPAIREAIALPASSSQTIKPMSGGLIYYDGMTLHAMNGRGKQIWSYSAGGMADFTVDKMGVSTWNGTKLTLLTERGTTIHSADMQNTVLSAHIGERYAAVQLGEEHNSEIVIIDYEQGGRTVDKISFADLTVLNYGFFYNGSLLWVLTLNTEGTVPLSMVSTYQPGKMQAGTISETDQILYKVIFQSSQIRAIGTKYIRSYDYNANENTSNRILVYGWQAVGVDRDVDNPLMAFAPTSQTGVEPKINDIRLIKGQQEQSVRFPIACFDVFVNNNAMYGFSSQYVFVAHMGDKKPIAYDLPVTVDSVFGITGDQSAIVSSGGVVYLVPLPV